MKGNMHVSAKSDITNSLVNLVPDMKDCLPLV